MKNYFEELKRAMNYLGEHPEVVFVGQAVEYEGTAMRKTLVDINPSKLIEWPICEDFQQGVCNGLALAGKIPVSIFPRWNFLLLATNQIANHLDKIIEISDYRPKVIIRTSIGSKSPMNPGSQHLGDYTEVFQKMLKNIEVIRLDRSEDIFPAYQKAYERTDGKSSLLVELGDAYDPNWEIPV